DPEPEPVAASPGVTVGESGERLVLEAVTATMTELPQRKPKLPHTRKQARAAAARRSTSPPAADPASLPEPVSPLPPAAALLPEPALLPEAVLLEPPPEAPAPLPATTPQPQPVLASGSLIYFFQWSGGTTQRHQAQTISIAKFHRQAIK
ncbi:MAG TPA: hypothetical protein VK464_26970, partial [Symbiobacteriaceae bacterium]|nr:hypothetical protein [Symbiobacteriaceae bacterium]